MNKQQFLFEYPFVRLFVLVFFTSLITACGSTTDKINELNQSIVCKTCPPCDCKTSESSDEKKPAAKPLQKADWNDLPGWNDDQVSLAWPAFIRSCQIMIKKQSTLTDWEKVCQAANTIILKPGQTSENDKLIRQFFTEYFQPWKMVNPDNSEEGMITGYYEPLLSGARKKDDKNRFGIFSPPDDLLTIDLAKIYPQLAGLRLRGRLEGNKVVPYWPRADLDESKFTQNAIAWVDDEIDLFFLQIQGSGQIKLADGKKIRVGYANQNGHPYQSIGRILVERGELKPETASMQRIKAWAHANPDKVKDLLNTNPSYVFFRELPLKDGQNPDDGPIGALNVPLVAGRSIAIDPRHITLGAPVFLATTEPLSSKPLNKLVLAQDTGGAIKGVVRADFFWGFGAEAGQQAGKMRQQGKMWLLLPKELKIQ